GTDNSPWAVTVDWGDDNPPTSFAVLETGPLGTRTHAYADSGTYTVTVTVTGGHHGLDSQRFRIDVANRAPTATFTGHGPVFYGTPPTLRFTGPSAPSPADTAAGFHYAFATDSADLAGATYANSASSPTAELTLAGAGLHTVYGRIIDKDGG